MADHFIGMNRGDVGYQDGQIFFATSTTSKNLEVRIGDAFGWTREELYEALHIIADKIVAPGSPDADSKFPVL